MTRTQKIEMLIEGLVSMVVLLILTIWMWGKKPEEVYDHAQVRR